VYHVLSFLHLITYNPVIPIKQDVKQSLRQDLQILPFLTALAKLGPTKRTGLPGLINMYAYMDGKMNTHGKKRKGVFHVKLGQAVPSKVQAGLRLRTSYPFRKAARLLSLNWLPENVVLYLMQDLGLERRHAKNIVNKAMFGLV
jgi:hypothetical protein